VNRSRKFEIERKKTNLHCRESEIVGIFDRESGQKEKKGEFFISSNKNATGERTKEIASAPSIKT